MSTPKAQPMTSTSSSSTDTATAVSSAVSPSTVSPSHWTRTSHVNEARHPLISTFGAKVALCTLSDPSNEVVDGIAAAEAWFDRVTSTLADRESLQRQARDVLSTFPLTETQRSEIEATRSVFDDEYDRDMTKLQKMREQQLHSVPHYTAEVIDSIKKTTLASEAAQAIIDAERVLSGLAMYPVPPSTVRSRLFSALRTKGVLPAESEATIRTWFDKHKQDRWKLGLDTENVGWVDQ